MKTPFVDYNLYLQSFNKTSNSGNTNLDNIQTASRSSTILQAFVGKKITVYNGKTSSHIAVVSSMVGQKLGAFVLTKKLGNSIHNSDHNRKVKEKARRKITQKKVRKTTTAAKPATTSKKKK